MIKTPVISSNLASVGYDPIQQILEVQFRSGDVYDYMNVSQDVYNGLLGAPSKGHYLYAVIKQGGYSYQKVYDFKTQVGSPTGAIGLSESMINPFTATTGIAAEELGLTPPTISPDTATPVIGDILGELGL